MINSLPVYSECYVREDGSDYKGKVYKTQDDTPCALWSSVAQLVPPEFALNLAQNPFLGQHSFCRNPGSLRELGPWCFKEGAASEDDWDYCDVPEQEDTCIVDMGKLTGLSAERLSCRN